MARVMLSDDDPSHDYVIVELQFDQVYTGWVADGADGMAELVV
jgi:hypothetical protein